jgi:hypothetical protein
MLISRNTESVPVLSIRVCCLFGHTIIYSENAFLLFTKDVVRNTTDEE